MAKRRKRRPPLTISQNDAVHRPGTEFFNAAFFNSEGMKPNDAEMARLVAEKNIGPTDDRDAKSVNAEIARLIAEKRVQPALAKVCNDMKSVTRLPLSVSGKSLSSFIILRKPKDGRPFEKESKGQITLTIDVAEDHSKVTITGDNKDAIPTKSRHFKWMFIKIASSLEEQADRKETYRRETDFIYPLVNDNGKPVEENNAQQIARRLRKLLMKCIPLRQQQAIIDAIRSVGTSIVIDPKLQFRLPPPTDTRYKQRSLEDGTTEPVANEVGDTDEMRDQGIWANDEEKDTVESWFQKRIHDLGIEEYKKNRAFLKRLFGVSDE